jgi:hypothetical protein
VKNNEVMRRLGDGVMERKTIRRRAIGRNGETETKSDETEKVETGETENRWHGENLLKLHKKMNIDICSLFPIPSEYHQ